MVTMNLRKLGFVLHAWLVSGLLLIGAPTTAFADDEDLDGDNVLESDEVSGDEEEYEDEETEGDDGSTTIVVRDTDPSAVVVFRDKLSPYGSWVDHPTYGTVWVPSSAVVGSDFAPYVSSGRWELTEDGEWLWVSDYDWGYIPFHYGRWVWVSGVGWAWIPGRVYAPAWVVWRTGAYGYVGWAPMPPAYYWVDGVAVSFWVVPPAPYVFCPTRHLFHHHVHTVVIHDRDEVGRAAKATKPYHPAKPNVKGQAHKPAQPTLKDAGVPRKLAPKSFGKHDPKAKAFMRPDAVSPKSGAMKRTSNKNAFTASPPALRGAASRRGAGITRGTSGADEPVFRSRSSRGSFSSGASRAELPKTTRGKSKATRSKGTRSAPPNSAAPRTKKSAPSRARSSSDDAPSSRAPSRSSEPSVSRSSSPRSPSTSSSKKSSRSAPSAPPPSVKRGASKPSRGRR